MVKIENIETLSSCKYYIIVNGIVNSDWKNPIY